VLRKSKLFVETEFLALAQALEGFHRAIMSTSGTDRATLRRVRKAVQAALQSQDIDPALTQRICESMMHANDPTLAARLAALCQSLSGATLSQMGIDPATFASNVKDTRNFYTHAGGAKRRSKRPSIKGIDMFLLNQKMRALLRGVMLLHLGFPEAQIAGVLAREATEWG
jgi:hypothetical protein